MLRPTVCRSAAAASALRVGAAFIIAFAASGCWEGVSRDVLATVLSVEGTASISLDEGHTFSPLRSGANAGRHAVVRTSPDSRLSLGLLPNCLVELEHNTSLQIERLGLTKDGNETGDDMKARSAEAKLITGKVLVAHAWGETRARLVVSTASGEVSTPSNAVFWLEFAEGTTRVTCVSGWVEFRAGDAARGTRVPPGSFGVWSATGGNVIAADADARGQDDLHHAAEVEQKLQALARQKRDVLPR